MKILLFSNVSTPAIPSEKSLAFLYPFLVINFPSFVTYINLSLAFIVIIPSETSPIYKKLHGTISLPSLFIKP